MREILFRGKHKQTGEWVEGFYEQTYTYDTKKQLHRILWNDEQTKTAFCSDIIPETLGQFTGLTDKNGKRIFEGDIVKGKFDELYIILWYPRNAQFIKFSGYDRVPWTDIESITKQNLINPLLQKDMCSDLKVIGNFIDNPELLTEERSENEKS